MVFVLLLVFAFKFVFVFVSFFDEVFLYTKYSVSVLVCVCVAFLTDFPDGSFIKIIQSSPIAFHISEHISEHFDWSFCPFDNVQLSMARERDEEAKGKLELQKEVSVLKERLVEMEGHANARYTYG